MKKISIKDVVAFRSKSDRSKATFVNNIILNREAVPNDEGGGDYWITCLSAISSSYKAGDVQPIITKREELEEKIEPAEHERTRIMYRRNISILHTQESSDFTKWTPSSKINFLRKKKDNYTLTIKGLLIQVKPHQVFAFNNDGIDEVGAIWFIAKLDGFKKDDLGMFTDILHRYLTKHFSDKYIISSRYCIAVDVFNNINVSYLDLENKEVPKILDLTLDKIKAFM